MRPSNPDIERYYFEKFITQYELPKGEVVYSDKPDVIITGEENLGIEITNFYYDPREQSQISMRLNAVKNAQKIYQETTNNYTEFHFGFNRQSPIKMVKKMTKNLLVLAERFSEYPIGSITEDKFEDVPEVSFVWRGEEYDDCEWGVSQIFSMPSMNVERLAEVIQEKERRAKEYAVCDKLWLLIVIDFMNLAQDQEIMNVHIDEIESDVFDKVILYKTLIEEIREVPIKNSFK